MNKTPLASEFEVLEIEEIKPYPSCLLSPVHRRLIGPSREYLDMSVWNRLDLQAQARNSLATYNHVRVHSAIVGTTPADRGDRLLHQSHRSAAFSWKLTVTVSFHTPVALVSNSPWTTRGRLIGINIRERPWPISAGGEIWHGHGHGAHDRIVPPELVLLRTRESFDARLRRLLVAPSLVR